VRIVIADDSVLIRQGVARLLVDQGFEVVGEAADGPELVGLVARERPDVAIVDIRMPPTNTDEGLKAAEEIRRDQPDVAVLVLSQHLEPAYAVRLVRDSPGGIGYLLKDRVTQVEELSDAIRRVAVGECVVDRAVVAELMARRRRQSPLDALSSRERVILGLMAEGRSNRGICDALWLSPKTVETHIRSLFGKLGLEEAPQDNRRTLAVLTYLRA
jgi:DNA-binding NarL/FixJ family response regulator